MIVLDTHIWIWWVHGHDQLPKEHAQVLKKAEASGIGVSAITCWEVAMLVGKGRLNLPRPIKKWFDLALAYPGMELLPITPSIAIRSVELPGMFHKDPADRIIVATALEHGCRLLTSDAAILNYRHVRTEPDR